jgi:hypothetical protein
VGNADKLRPNRRFFFLSVDRPTTDAKAQRRRTSDAPEKQCLASGLGKGEEPGERHTGQDQQA